MALTMQREGPRRRTARGTSGVSVRWHHGGDRPNGSHVTDRNSRRLSAITLIEISFDGAARSTGQAPWTNGGRECCGFPILARGGEVV